MATTNDVNSSLDELPLTTTGEPTDQLEPEEDSDDTNLGEDDLDDTALDETEPDADDAEFDEAPLDDDEDLDEDEVNRLFPGENSYKEDETDDDEPYEGIRKEGEEEDDLVDDNMTGMPVVPSPS